MTIYGIRSKKGKLVKADEKHLRKVRSRIGMVFQHFNLFPHMTILRNVTEAPVRVLGLSKEEAEERAIDMLTKVGLKDHLNKYPGTIIRRSKAKGGYCKSGRHADRISCFLMKLHLHLTLNW